MNNYDENGFYKESSLVTIPKREYDRLVKSEKELQRMKKLNRPPDVEYRKKSLFGDFNIFGRDVVYSKPDKPQKPPIEHKER